ncbi:DUF3618 domain-containing protein [Streptomyces sp. NPDC052236]|uniref:DUF3618 domain-containing protein n=1 Tax=Streptomyces sp. NPDC052236 TaxID=3365686 RepID=UPI0037D6F9AF
MRKHHETDGSAGGLEELREQVKHARDQLGDTVEELTAKADVKARAQEKAARLAEGAQHRAKRAAHAVQERTPEPVRKNAAAAPLIAVGAAGLVTVLVLRRQHSGSTSGRSGRSMRTVKSVRSARRPSGRRGRWC